MPSEFALIDRYFKRPPRHAVLGVGDDGAIVRPTPGMELVVSTDMLVAGTHFLSNADPADLGWKTLAVNVSDMAAMGATARWALLAAGELPAGSALLRSGAQVGDEVWVSGRPGLAALGLAHVQGRCALDEPLRAECLAALNRPQPRVALGLALRGIASAAIDVSDGLLADLGHILEASKLAATLHFDRLPDAALHAGVDATLARDCLLAGGDDYELVFTAPAARHGEIEALAASLPLALTCIGSIEAGDPGSLQLLDAAGQPMNVERRGFDHFSSGLT